VLVAGIPSGLGERQKGRDALELDCAGRLYVVVPRPRIRLLDQDARAGDDDLPGWDKIRSGFPKQRQRNIILEGEG